MYRRNREGTLAGEIDWHAEVKALLKAELKRRNVSYRDLAERLERLGVAETEQNIANKISRGGFSAVFFVQCLRAVGAKEVRLD
jgi:3-mercaptopyruvate sulfurtransferase SseA